MPPRRTLPTKQRAAGCWKKADPANPEHEAEEQRLRDYIAQLPEALD